MLGPSWSSSYTRDFIWIKLGTLPDWLSSAAALLAAVAASLLWRQQGRQIQIESKALEHRVKPAPDMDQAAAHDRPMEQARNVHFRLEQRGGGSSTGGLMTRSAQVEVVNNSRSVTRHVSARVWHRVARCRVGSMDQMRSLPPR